VTVRTVCVIHREPLVARALASALGRHPSLAPAYVGSEASDALRTRADAIVLDAGLENACEVAGEVSARGRRIVLLGGAAASPCPTVSTEATVDQLAAALAPVQTQPSGPLSRRERQVVALAAKGLAGKQVAAALGISPKTVERHKSRIFAKLGVPNQAAAVALAGRACEGVAWTS